MRELYLVRHAKASWAHPELEDIKRELTDQGEQDAKHMAAWLKHRLHQQKSKIDFIMTSNAARALATAHIFARELGTKEDKLVINPQLFENTVSALVPIIHKIDDKYATAMLIGHNPSLIELINNYLFDDHPAHTFPTGAICCIQFDTDKWSKISEVNNKLLFNESPEHIET
jgi:phosphohistidine phosphatase